MLSFKFLEGTVLNIEENVIIKLLENRQIEGRFEAGGILLGKKVEGREEYILTDISEPSLNDKRGKYSFIRDKKTAQAVVNKYWKKTNGVVNYLGEWHTHPECTPSPSQTDRNLLRQVINDKSNVFDKVFLIIVGLDKSLYIGLSNAARSNEILFSILLNRSDDFKIVRG